MLTNSFRPVICQPPCTGTARVAGRPPRDGLPISASVAAELISAPSSTTERQTISKTGWGHDVVFRQPSDQVNSHIDRHRRCATAARQAFLRQSHLEQVGAVTAVLWRRNQSQISRVTQIGKVGKRKHPLAVVAISALSEARREFICQRNNAALAIGQFRKHVQTLDQREQRGSRCFVKKFYLLLPIIIEPTASRQARGAPDNR